MELDEAKARLSDVQATHAKLRSSNRAPSLGPATESAVLGSGSPSAAEAAAATNPEIRRLLDLRKLLEVEYGELQVQLQESESAKDQANSREREGLDEQLLRLRAMLEMEESELNEERVNQRAEYKEDRAKRDQAEELLQNEQPSLVAAAAHLQETRRLMAEEEPESGRQVPSSEELQQLRSSVPSLREEIDRQMQELERTHVVSEARQKQIEELEAEQDQEEKDARRLSLQSLSAGGSGVHGAGEIPPMATVSEQAADSAEELERQAQQIRRRHEELQRSVEFKRSSIKRAEQQTLEARGRLLEARRAEAEAKLKDLGRPPGASGDSAVEKLRAGEAQVSPQQW